MHKCVRCDRTATTIEEIHDGCPCGSKAFVFIRDSDPLSTDAQSGGSGEKKAEANVSVLTPPQQDGNAAPAGSSGQAQPEKMNEGATNGKAPSSYFARMTFTTEDVENIKIVTEGVFAVDVNALSKNPVVLKDEEGIYYVKLPFEQNGKKLSEKKK